jgi:Family of unknown function (DUF6455)
MDTWDMINERRSLRDIVSNWWRNWRSERAQLAELAECGSDETGRIAHDMGLTAPCLLALARKGPDAADLLPRRIAALHMDATEIARAEPVVLRDLQRLCTLCESKGHCAHDLDQDVTTAEWERYCPNAYTLSALKVGFERPFELEFGPWGVRKRSRQ